MVSVLLQSFPYKETIKLHYCVVLDKKDVGNRAKVVHESQLISKRHKVLSMHEDYAPAYDYMCEYNERLADDLTAWLLMNEGWIIFGLA